VLLRSRAVRCGAGGKEKWPAERAKRLVFLFWSSRVSARRWAWELPAYATQQCCSRAKTQKKTETAVIVSDRPMTEVFIYYFWFLVN
jgi:hypothetical protein